MNFYLRSFWAILKEKGFLRKFLWQNQSLTALINLLASLLNVLLLRLIATLGNIARLSMILIHTLDQEGELF